jgi:16S rRNA processing protein RimM
VLVVVGRIGRAHGLRGEVSIDVRTDEPETRFAPGSVVMTDTGRAGSARAKANDSRPGLIPKELTVATVRWHQTRLLVRFEGFDDRTAAESIQGISLNVNIDPTQRPAADDEFYDVELEGMSVSTQDGLAVGVVTEVLHLPGQDLLAVKKSNDVEILIPFVSELVPTIDRDARLIVVRDPGGLIDDAEAEQ